MEKNTSKFLHLLIFKCQNCGAPVVAHTMVDGGNLEEVDGATFDLQCVCGLQTRQTGIAARKHLVEKWTPSTEQTNG